MSLPTSSASTSQSNPGPQADPASQGAAQPRPRSARRFALRLLASLIVLAVLASLLNRREVLDRLSEFAQRSPGVWAGALALFLLLHAGGAMKWRLFLALCGARLDPRSALRFYGAGLFANLCLPTMIGGDVVRAGLALGTTENKEAVVLGSLADRLADLLALCLLSAGACLLSPSARTALAARSITPSTILLAFSAILVVGVVALAVLLRASGSRAGNSALARVLGGSSAPKLARVLDNARGAAAALVAKPARAAAGFLLCLALQSGFVLVNAWIGGAMGLSLDLAAWFLVVPLAKIAAMMPVSLSGLGVREVAVAALMAPLGVLREDAVAQSLVWQSVLVAGSLLAGLLAALASRRREVADGELARALEAEPRAAPDDVHRERGHAR